MDQFFHIVYLIFLSIYVLMVVVTVYNLVHERRDPSKALSWIAVVVSLPVVGLIAYLFFGQNYRKQKIFSRKELKDLAAFDALSTRQIHRIDYSKSDIISNNKDIITLILNNSKSLLTMGNDINVLNNGKQTFSSIIEDLKSAQNSIHLEYYIIENDVIGNTIADILKQKAESGVEVRVIYDDVGSWSLGKSFIKPLRQSGVEIYCFMPVVFPWFTSKVNYRNHRKIIVIDGKIGYTGGLNIADRYINGTKNGAWRDTHMRIVGPAVNMLQVTFLTDWYFVTRKKMINYPNYYLAETDGQSLGNTALQIVASGPDSDHEAIMQAYFAAITKAKKHIYISTPYFLPNETILTAIKVAAMSGIDVRIMLPSKSDSKIVHWASRSYFTELLQAGVKIFLYTSGFNHSKLMTVDSTFSSIGTANMDIRSFEDNFEISAMIYDKQQTQIIENQFLEDLTHCYKMTLRRWRKRKHKDNFKESIARLFSPLL